MQQQPARPLWVYFAANGDHEASNAVKVNIAQIPDLNGLFEKAKIELNPNNYPIPPFTRVFSKEGIEIKSIDQIYQDDRLYFACFDDENFIQANTDGTTSTTQSSSSQPVSQDGYLYTTAVFTSGLISSTYAALSHAVRTHAPQQVVNSFNTLEEGVQYYSSPLVQSSLPYLSSGVTWTDQLLNQCISATTQQTQQFLATPTGQKMTSLKDNVSDYASKAVASFKSVTSGENGDNTQQSGHEQQQTYLAHFKQSMGHQWNDVLVPWALSTYHDLHNKYTQEQQNSNNNSVNNDIDGNNNQLGDSSSQQ